MKARFVIENPDEMEATIKITMSVKQWVELRDQLNNLWPSSRLSQAITSVVIQARKVFYAEETDAF